MVSPRVESATRKTPKNPPTENRQGRPCGPPIEERQASLTDALLPPARESSYERVLLRKDLLFISRAVWKRQLTSLWQYNRPHEAKKDMDQAQADM